MCYLNFIRLISMVLALASTTAFATGISYTVTAVDAQRIQIAFSIDSLLPASSLQDQKALLAISSSPMVVLLPVFSSHTGVTPLRSARVRSAGWVGKEYMQWIEYTPFYNHETATNLIRQGTLTITFSQPIITAKTINSCSVTNNRISFPIVRVPTALKKTTAAIQPPYTRGLRIEIDADGIYALTGLNLRNLGVATNAIQSPRYRLFNKTTETPLYIPGNPARPLNDNDTILFYGRMLRGTTSYYSSYSNTNVYWLTWEGSPGLRMTAISGKRDNSLNTYQVLSQDTASVLANDFPDTIHVEQDNQIFWMGSIYEPEELEMLPDSLDTIDNWLWETIGSQQLSTVSCELPSPSNQPGSMARLRISLRGLTSITAVPDDHKYSIFINNNSPGSPGQSAQWDGQNDFVFESERFPASYLVNGTNTITFAQDMRGFVDQAAVNWIECIYDRTFTALDNELQFKISPVTTPARVQFTLRNFTESSVDIWDITNLRIIADYDLAATPTPIAGKPTTSIVFQDKVFGPTLYAAQARTKRRTPEAMLDSITDPAARIASAVYTIITADTFRTAFKPLIAFHTNAGRLCSLVTMRELYNRYAYGIKDPECIRSLFVDVLQRYNHLPEYVLLGGDATHDLDKKNQARTLVPTHLSRVPGWGPSSDDGYFACVNGTDNYGDFAIGRFPAETPAQMVTLVDKTIRYATNPDYSSWRDNLLLAGGHEQDFTLFNNQAGSDIIGPTMNILRIDADQNSPFYTNRFVAASILTNYLNAGVYAVNFNGHGGGNVWSDNSFFSYTDIASLYNGSWGHSGRLPIVFSFTCLTGFFESVDYQSLGEEFIRSSRHGAIAFFGASAYTPKLGNVRFNSIVLDHAMNNAPGTLGRLLLTAKNELLARYDNQYITLARQYNLLGDPALNWRLAADSLHVNLSSHAYVSGDTIRATIATPHLQRGMARVQIKNGYEQWFENQNSIAADTIKITHVPKSQTIAANGTIRIYGWNDSMALRGFAPFTCNAIAVRQVQLSPWPARFGDSVRVSCIVADFQTTGRARLNCLFAIDQPIAASPFFGSITMHHDSQDIWSSNEKIFCMPKAELQNGDISKSLLLKFQLVDSSRIYQSAITTFPLLGLSDLRISRSGITLSWRTDSLYASVEVLNGGNARAKPFTLLLLRTAALGNYDTLTRITYNDSLPAAHAVTLGSTIADTTGRIIITAVIQSAGRELSIENNRGSDTVQIAMADIASLADTLWSTGRGCAIFPAQTLPVSHRVFLFSSVVRQRQPLLTASRWIALRGDSVKMFFTAARPALSSSESLTWQFYPADSARLPKQVAGSATQTIFGFDSNSLQWYALKAIPATAVGLSVTTVLRGSIIPGSHTDNTPPAITVSVEGRDLTFLDYVSKDKPFNISITDQSAIVPSSITIALNGVALDSSQRSLVFAGNNYTACAITAYCLKQRAVDTLTISARDCAGNIALAKLAYLPGENFDIKFLSCHPNPFTARQNSAGQTAQSVRLAFLLSDFADEATVTVYTITGRPVKRFVLNNIIGYHELEWDGKTDNGVRIANGTYYLKLVARRERVTVNKIIPLAKIEGY